FSKIVSEEWKKLSEEEKSKWQRKYHISRDQQLHNSINKCAQIELQTYQMGENENANANHVTNNIYHNENSMDYPKVNEVKLQINLLQGAVITNQSEEGSSKIHPSSIYYKYYTL
ncbi:15393_t:CDS:1, partial [Funneliformis caledonium]